MKKKYLILTGLLCSWMGWQPVEAQTDVTAQYLQNPDFEGTYEVQTNPQSDRAIYKPEGWTVTLNPVNENDMSILKTTDLASNNFTGGFTVNDEATRGEQTYWFRYRWGAKQTLKLSQSIENLPAGMYRLTADVVNYSQNYNYTVMIYAGQYAQSRAAVSTSKGDNWNTVSCDFYVEEDGDIEVGFSATNGEAAERIFGVDNFKLYRLEAEEPTVDNPVDMTGYIVNPCFDFGSLDGWTSTTGAQNRTIAQNKGGAITGKFYENWNGSPYSGTIEQTINNLPLGVYTLRLAAFRSGGSGNTYVFANEDMTLITTDDGAWYEVETNVTDGTLTFGVKSVDNGCNWTGVDNASLTYKGVDLTMLKEALADALQKAKEIDQTPLNTYAKTRLNAAIGAAENVKMEKKALNAATDELLNSMALANDVAAVYPSAVEFINECKSIKDNSVASDKTVFGTAIETAETDVETAETVEAVKAVVNTLETARQTYVLAAQPKDGFVFDVTFKIVNAAVASSDGWSGTRMNAGEQYDGAPDNTYFDIWNATMNMTQAVSGLPEGVYSLKAATRAEANVTVGNIYVESDGETFRTDIHHVGNSGNELGGGWGWTLVDGIKVTSGNIKIGFYAECGNGKWAGADDFHLYYSGIADPFAVYAPLRAKADELLAFAMSAECRKALSGGGTLTSEASRGELLQAIVDLQAAIAGAEVSIANYAYLQRETATAKSFGIDVAAEEAAIAGGTYDDEAAVAAAQAMNVATYNKVVDGYTYEVEVKEWSGEIGQTSGQHWSGDGRSYYDTNGTGITRSLTTAVTLPAGEYVLMAAGRSAPAATMELKIDDTTVKFTAKGDTGYGIETSGQANFSESGTYAYDGRGRGWEWEFVHLNLTEEKEVTLKAVITTSGWAWGSFSDIMLKMDKTTFDKVYYSRLAAALEECKPWNSGNEYADVTYPGYKAAYENKTYTDAKAIEQAIADLKAAFDAYALENIDAEHSYDATSRIANPNYDNGIDGWERTQNSTGGYSDGVNADGAYYYSAVQQMRHATCYQTISLPAGTYRLSATMTGNPYTENGTYIYATTGEVNHWADPVFAGDVWYGYYTPARDWDVQNVYTLFTLKEAADVRIGVLSWGRNASGNTRGGFTVDNWKLEKLLYAVDGDETDVVFVGKVPVDIVNEKVAEGVCSINLTEATDVSDMTIDTGNNPNLLIYAKEGQVANTRNVVVGGTCASLVLADGHPFAAPAGFTATSATYNMSAVATTVGGEGFGTLCLPFEATALAGEAYNLNQGATMGGELYATKVTSIPANTPVLVKAKGAYSGQNVTVAATKAGAAHESGELVGVYKATPAPVGSFVLQKHNDKVAFYLVGSEVQPTVNPFRAYIRPQAEAASLDMLSVVFGFDDVTAVGAVGTAESVTEVSRYDATGVRIDSPRKGMNIVRMSDGSVRKVLVK